MLSTRLESRKKQESLHMGGASLLSPFLKLKPCRNQNKFRSNQRRDLKRQFNRQCCISLSKRILRILISNKLEVNFLLR